MRDVPYHLYVSGLSNSRTGKNLAKMLPFPLNSTNVKIINASPNIGEKSSSYYAADVEYLLLEIETVKPDLIFAFGNAATKGLESIGVEHYAMPHPASRTLSTETINAIRDQLKEIINEKT